MPAKMPEKIEVPALIMAPGDPDHPMLSQEEILEKKRRENRHSPTCNTCGAEMERLAYGWKCPNPGLCQTRVG